MLGILALSSRPAYAQGIITTVAGGPTIVTPVEIEPFTGGVAVDMAGNLYIADTESHRIYRVSPGGETGTVAGFVCWFCARGEERFVEHEGFSGDGGWATDALLDSPSGVCTDASGNLYIVDTANQRIRRVVGHVITTVAGNGNAGLSGDGGPASSASLHFVYCCGFNRHTGNCAVDRAGNLYIPDTENDRIRKVGTDGTITTVALVRWPYSVAVDDEFILYIGGENGVVKVDSSGSSTTVASGLNVPAGVAVDRAGNVYIADSFNHRVRKVEPDGASEVVAGSGDPVFDPVKGYYFVGGYSGDGGPATTARLNFPWGVAVDAAGNIYIADSVNDRIRKVVFESTFPPTVLKMDSTAYCVGASWSLTVNEGAPNSSARLLGISNGQSWEISEWRRTDDNGGFSAEGTFAEGTQGNHTLNVQIGGVFSSPVTFTAPTVNHDWRRPQEVT
jgi:sugar lactone lactonase YvrE